MINHQHERTLTALFVACLSACGGGGGSSGDTTPTAPSVAAQSVAIPVLISDASSEDWSTIGVKVLALSLVKQDGTLVAVPLGTAPLALNLAQLDQLGEVLSSVTLKAGDVYTGAKLTLSANLGDVSLTVSADPESGFPVAAGTAIPAAQIQIQNAQGAAGSQTVTASVVFDKPVVMPSTPGAALNVEVDLSHPAFIVGHVPAGGGATVWAVNFNGPVAPKRVDDITRQVLRHMYGSVSSVAADFSSLTLAKDLPTLPIVTPEVPVPTGQSLAIQVDATNGTLFYDLDGKTSASIKSLQSVASAVGSGKYVRVAARYQQDGTLVASRIWASSSFNTVWVSPEGHVLHVDNTNNQIVIADEAGKPVKIQIAAGTEFFFRTPEKALSDTTPIGTGTGFLAAHNIVRGFKVHVQVADPLSTPMVAQTVDIETAAYEGKIGSVTNSGFSYTNTYTTAGDNYTMPLSYIAPTAANGKDSSGAAILGFDYWSYGYPTLVTSGSSAISTFAAAAGGSVDFGGTAGAFTPRGASYARWGDTANPTGWAVPWVVLVPVALPRATVASTVVGSAFAVTVPGASRAVTVNFSAVPGSATLAYQVDRTNGVVTVSPQDLTSAAGLAALTSGLRAGAQVKVSAVPQADGSLRAYTLSYFRGDQPR